MYDYIVLPFILFIVRNAKKVAYLKFLDLQF